jgi:hypothetical protein
MNRAAAKPSLDNEGELHGEDEDKADERRGSRYHRGALPRGLKQPSRRRNQSTWAKIPYRGKNKPEPQKDARYRAGRLSQSPRPAIMVSYRNG